MQPNIHTHKRFCSVFLKKTKLKALRRQRQAISEFEAKLVDRASTKTARAKVWSSAGLYLHILGPEFDHQH